MPLVFLAVRASLAGLPLDLIEAVRSHSVRPAQMVARIALPIALPGFLAGSVLAFAAVGNFGIPALLGIPGRFPMLTTLIYRRLNGFGPSVIGTVAVMALVLVALAGAALIARVIIARLFTVAVPHGVPFRGLDPGRWRQAVEASLWTLFATLTILPVLALFGTALVPALGVPLTLATATTENLTEAMANPTIRRAFTNSLMLSGGAAVIAGVLALALAFFAVVLQGRLARMLDLVADAPFVVPGTVLGIAMILVYLRPLPGIGVSIYDISMILALAYLGHFLPLVLRSVGDAMAALDPSLD